MLIVAVPLILICAGAATYGFTEANRAGIRADGLEQSAWTLVLSTKALEAQADVRRTAPDNAKQLDALLEASPPSYLLLNELKRGLPGGVAISKLEIHGGVATVAVRTSDALALVRTMNEHAGWKASAVGTIASDPTTRTDIASISIEIDK